MAALARINFSRWGRLVACLDAFALTACGVYTLFNTNEGKATWLSIYTICTSFLVFLVEMPVMCSCISFCKVVSRYTRFIAGFWMTRGLTYILIAGGAFAIATQTPEDKNWVLLVVHGVLTGAAAAYVIAALKREDAPDGSSQGVPAEVSGAAKQQASRFGGFFARGAAKAVTENPEVAGAVAAAAVPTLAQQMFGGAGGFGASSAPVGGPVDSTAINMGFGSSSTAAGGSGGGLESFKPSGGTKGFYDDDDDDGPVGGAGGGAASKEALFSGGGLFGGGGAPAAQHSPVAAPAPDASAVTASKAAKYGVSGSGTSSLGAPLTGGDDGIPEDNPFAS